MAVTSRELIPAKLVENTLTTQFTATAATAVVQVFTVTNITAAVQTISVHLVAGGDTAGTANKVIDARRIAAGETYDFPELAGHVLEAGSSMATIASAGSSIVLRVSGIEIT